MPPALGRAFLDDAAAGRPLSEPAWATPADVEAAIAAAFAARRAVAATTRERRIAVLRDVADGLMRDADAFAALIARDVAKPIDAARVEVARAATTFRDAAAVAATDEGRLVPLDTVPGGAGREALVRRVPIGVVAAITPFNFPINLVAHKVAPAVATGCPLILKPAPAAARTACAFGALVDAAVASHGLPREAFACVAIPESGDPTPLVEDPRIRGLTFTGSEAVGWALRDRAAGKAVALELGGDAFAIVAADAPLRHAAERIAFGAFAYAGQVCISVQHVLVHASVLDAFLEVFRDIVAGSVVGDPLRTGVLAGPLLRDRDADRVEAWVHEALDRGARIEAVGRIDAPEAPAGAGWRRGRWIAPLALRDVPAETRLHGSEVFGPVVDVAAWSTIDDIERRLDASRFGLQAGVFTQDLGLVRRLYTTLDVGGLVVGDVPTLRLDPMPYGGMKRSGLGREGARDAFDWYTEPKTLLW